ncbi:MAG: EF-hand domain-containing protein, partial [Candidatus Thermoplasmatota archaeon]|nr:EF-hand domain-containing protein [Candidatus Thermoplasmatota archaeon]
NLTDRKAAKVTDNAFEGAFGMIATPSLTAQETDMVEHQDSMDELHDEMSAEDPIDSEEAPEIEIPDEAVIEEPFVSAAEMFIQADSDNDGSLSVEELSLATGLSEQESAELHKSADKDEDGKMSLSEFVASSAAEKVASNLPRPVAPVRRPVNRTESRPTMQSNPPPQQPIPAQNLQPRPIQPNPLPQPMNNLTPQYPPQQTSWNQTVQPTIRSGVSCRGCGIGIDPFWRFCPVCGGQNLN